MRLLASWLTCPLAFLALSGGACRWPSFSDKGPPSAEEAARKREERQKPVSIIAPPPAAARSVLAGPEGQDRDGYPLRYVDRLHLRGLLREGRYADLNRAFEELQDAFEADPRCEYWPSDAADAFAIADLTLDAPLDAWVAATPDAFAPYLARGSHRVEVGFARRGGAYVNETHPDNFDSMEAAHAQALPDLAKAVRIRPKLVEARRPEMRVYMTKAGQRALLSALAAGLQQCRGCFLIRVTALHALRPRWGGSHEQMEEVARAAPVGLNPRLRLLAGFVDWDLSYDLEDEKDLPGALAAIDRATALGEYWLFIERRAGILAATRDYADARRALDRAIELRPGSAGLMTRRARYALRLKDYEAAGRDLLEGLRLDPTESRGRSIFADVVKGVIYAGWEAHKAGEREKALQLLELAADLDPTNQDIARRQAWIVSPRGSPAVDELETLRAAAAAAPEDFRAQQALDYALAKQGRFAEVIALWDEYLERKPEDGRAHMERGGALHHLGRDDEARAAARRACEFGVSEGVCGHADDLGSIRNHGVPPRRGRCGMSFWTLGPGRGGDDEVDHRARQRDGERDNRGANGGRSRTEQPAHGGGTRHRFHTTGVPTVSWPIPRYPGLDRMNG